MSKADIERRIREHAHQIWLSEGCPEGREAIHRQKARELVAQEDRQQTATEPNPATRDRIWGKDEPQSDEPVEPLLSAENQGDLPTLTDQGEEATYPRRRRILRRR